MGEFIREHIGKIIIGLVLGLITFGAWWFWKLVFDR